MASFAAMQAAVLYGKEDVRLESVPVPAIAAGELLVRVRTALTCGTDVKVFRRGYHAKMIQPPALFGHEWAGDVVAVGQAVTKFQVGQRIVAANSAPCDACFFCRQQQPNLCEDLLFNNGAYAEYIRVPERIVRTNAYAIPDDLDYKDAALTEPLACALRAIDESNVRAGQTVAIMGLGPLGLMLVRLARHACKARVIAIARRLEQVDRAILQGAETGILMGEDSAALISEMRKQTAGRGADVVIEAIGQPNAWELATHLVRKGGTINFFGGCPSGTRWNSTQHCCTTRKSPARQASITHPPTFAARLHLSRWHCDGQSSGEPRRASGATAARSLRPCAPPERAD